MERSSSTLIGKSWKSHPNIFPKFQFFGWSDRFQEKSSIFGKWLDEFSINRPESSPEFKSYGPGIDLDSTL